MKSIPRILRTKNQNTENIELVAAMNSVARQDNNHARHRLYTALLDSTLVVPTPELPAAWSMPGRHIANGKTAFQIVTVDKADGTSVTPVFSDEAALRNWDPNMPSVKLKGRDYFLLVHQTPIQEVAINPFDPIRKMIRVGGSVRRWEIDILAKGEIPTPHPAT